MSIPTTEQVRQAIINVNFMKGYLMGLHKEDIFMSRDFKEMCDDTINALEGVGPYLCYLADKFGGDDKCTT